eukprot:m.307220 g.307220  ORF g.307220 m.307220 type:complete len:58 (+) comp19627_c0_seq7:111-284(+)
MGTDTSSGLAASLFDNQDLTDIHSNLLECLPPSLVRCRQRQIVYLAFAFVVPTLLAR